MKSQATSNMHDTFQDNDDLLVQVPPDDLMEDLRHHDHARLTFLQTNLISDGFVSAQQTDQNLINPWGVSYGPTSPFWISENNSGVTSIDSLKGGTLTVNAIPPVTIAPASPGGDPATPTGQVFNAFSASGAFSLTDGSPATFIFATEDGTISGWNKAAGTRSLMAVNDSQDTAHGDPNLGGAVYKGLAIAQTADGPMLYAANFRHGTVDVFDKNFNQMKSFTDPHLPKGYAPFNVQVLNDKLFVTFALQDDTKHDDLAGKGHGFVDEFDLNGHLVERIASHGPLDSPWGLAIAPQSFGKFAGDLLVGNFGDGTIDAFDMHADEHGHGHEHEFMGRLLGADGKPIVIGDLWALIPGNGGSAGDPNALYFTAGVQDEAHGLFGSLTPNPAPTTIGSHSMFG
jgi:uncharacterized protein (TIGR03118 family)